MTSVAVPRVVERELALAQMDLQDHGTHERVNAFDIVACREPIGYIGQKERTTVLWLRMRGPDYVFDILKHPMFDVDSTIDPTVDLGAQYDKRRFCIPARRLYMVALDAAKLEDANEEYQPFEVFNDDDGVFTARHPPVWYAGLIYDKRTGEFLL